MSRIVKIANAVMLALFLCWAGFQYNDPDAVLWIVIYLGAAVICVLAFLGRLSGRAATILGGLYMGAAIYVAANVLIGGEFFFDERGREAMGLAICGGWTLVLRRRAAPAPIDED